MSLDSIINTLIGPVIFLALVIWIYTKAKKPIDQFFTWLGEKIRNRGEGDEKYEGSYDIDYQPVGTYDFNDGK